MMKYKYDSIPLHQIPEGIVISMKNCERYLEEGKVLRKNDHYASALVSLMTATEEFSKCSFLLEHFKEGNDIPQGNELEAYFSDHKIRLAKFHEIFQKNLPSFDYNQAWANFNKTRGKSDQRIKLSLMYIDWLNYSWHNPLESIGIVPSPDQQFVTTQLKGSFNILKLELEILINTIKQDSSYIEAISFKKADNISTHKINVMIEEMYGDNIPTSLELTLAHKKVSIKIKPINDAINRENNLKLKKKIEKRFNGFSATIELD